jgi:hypothetical protein
MIFHLNYAEIEHTSGALPVDQRCCASNLRV